MALATDEHGLTALFYLLFILYSHSVVRINCICSLLNVYVYLLNKKLSIIYLHVQCICSLFYDLLLHTLFGMV